MSKVRRIPTKQRPLYHGYYTMSSGNASNKKLNSVRWGKH